MDVPTLGAERAEGLELTGRSGWGSAALAFDGEGRVVHVSPAAATALGVTAAGLTGGYLVAGDEAGNSPLDALDRLRQEVQRSGNTLRAALELADGARYVCVVSPRRAGVLCTFDTEPPGGEGPVDPGSPVFAHAPIGMGLVTLDGTWLRVNRAMAALTGVDAAALTGTALPDVVLPEDRFADFVYHRQLLAGELVGYQLEQRWLRCDGAPVWVRVSVSAVCRDGSPDHLLVQVQDITAHREAEARARLLAELVHCSPDAIWARDGGGEIVFWNRAAAQLLGYVAEDLVGSSASADLPATRIAETAHVLAIAAGGHPVGPVETIRRHKDGHDVDVSLIVSPILDREGLLVGFASVARALEPVVEAADGISRAGRAGPG
jgi:PAS domain S-box-containing protein